MTTIAARLQFFASLSGSQQDNAIKSRSPRGSQTSFGSQPSLTKANGVTRSMGNLSSGPSISTQPENPSVLSVKDRIARYGSNSKLADTASSPMSDIKARFHGSVDSVRAEEKLDAEVQRRPSAGAAEPAYRRRLSASRAAPYPAPQSVSRHGSDQDLKQQEHADELTSAPAPEPELLRNQTVMVSTPATLSDRINAFKSAAPARAATTPARPSSAPASKFGSNPKCACCTKPVYLMEQVTIDNQILHKTCLKCAHCKVTLKMGNLASLNGSYYCKPHFKQLFKLKGNYAEGFGLEDHKKNWLEAKEDKSA